MILKKQGRRFRGISLLILIICIFSVFSQTGIRIPTNEIEAACAEVGECICCESATPCHANEKITVSSRLYELLFKKNENASRMYLIPGGEVFGIKIKEDHVTVSSAKEGSSLKRGDKILSINGIKTATSEDVSASLAKCGGRTVKIDIMRGGEKMTLTVIPKLDEGSYKLGVTLRNTASGIGTITFVDPDTNVFGGLGHGVTEFDGTELAEISSGEATGVVLGNVVKGEVGKPGELSGILNKKHLGCIEENNECGVFGVLENTSYCSSKPLPVAKKEEAKVGEAEIISTLKNGKRATYKILISEISDSDSATKSFKIKVTDPILIALSGGIVRGMSGSPIIQNGMLIGAVTHVMVADPTEGYGIFIENMLASVPKTLPNAA